MNESKHPKIAICTYKPRTAALLYDKIFWQPIYDIQGANWQFYGIPDSLKYFPGQDHLNEFGQAFGDTITADMRSHPEANKNISNHWMKAWSEYCAARLGVHVVPVYESLDTVDEVNQIGEHQVLLPVLSNIEVVSEENLSWQQVEEFSNDKYSRMNYRCLVHWLDKEMVGKPQSFIEDEIAIRIDDYNTALKKHGITSVLGSLSYFLGEGFIKAATAALGVGLVGGVLAGLGAGGALLVGRTSVKLAEKAYDFRHAKRDEQGELAYVFDLQSKLSS